MNKKTVIIIFVSLIILTGVFLVWNWPRVKPLMVGDIVEASSSNLTAYIGVGFEKKSKSFYSLGEINKAFRDTPWKDNNNFADGKKYPLMISVSNQEGEIEAQILNIVYDNNKVVQVYVPGLSGKGFPWAYFFVDKNGSTYWACATKEPCDVGTLGSGDSLKKANLARKSP